MEKKFIKITDKEEWQNKLNQVLFKTFFHNRDWEDFLEKELSWLKFERYLYGNSALLSFARVRGKLISHPFCEYGGLLPLEKGISVDQFNVDFFLEFKDPFRIKFHPHFLDYFIRTRTVLVPSGNVSYFLEGAPDLRKTTRHEIEKAKNSGIFLEECKSEKELKAFYSLYLKNMKRHKTIAYPFSFFKYFLSSPDSEIILTKLKEKIIAGSLFLFYGKFVHYFLNASDEKHKKLGASYLILWHQMERYKNLVFDFGGTREGSSLETFKRGWGGKERPILELTNGTMSDLHGRSDIGILRNVFGFLPPFLIEKISPYLLKYKL